MRPGGVLATVAALMILTAGACDGPEASPTGAAATLGVSVPDRAARRAYAGAPPVIPHERLGSSCIACHGPKGMKVPGVGFAPPNPHGETRRCTQCHVFKTSDTEYRGSRFFGLRRERHGASASPVAPPVMPHPLQLRENCAACHTGPAARADIRCTHPERVHCLQCHVPGEARTVSRFRR